MGGGGGQCKCQFYHESPSWILLRRTGDGMMQLSVCQSDLFERGDSFVPSAPVLMLMFCARFLKQKGSVSPVYSDV